MKILQVYPYFYPAWSYGGVTRVTYELSKRLVDIGHEVTVYTTDALDEKSRVRHTSNPININGIEVYYFRNISNYLTYKHHIPLPLEMIYQIRKDIKKFDIIHLHGHWHSLNIITHHYAKKYSMPYVLQAHGSLPILNEKQKFKKLYNLIGGNKILKDASKVIALTKTETEQYKKMGVKVDKIKIVPNGVALSEYDNLPKIGEFKKKYGIKENEKVVLYLGRIHQSKGLDLLVNAFAELPKEIKESKLAIVGPDDGFLSTLESQTKKIGIYNKVLFTGPLYAKNKLEAYVDADIFVTPKFFGFPVAFLESCACGTPIITTNNGDKLDWIYDNVGIVTEYNKEHLRDAIFRLLGNEGLRTIFGNNARSLIRKQFDWCKIVFNVEKIYLNTIRDHISGEHIPGK